MRKKLKLILFCCFFGFLSLLAIPAPMYSYPDAAKSVGTEKVNAFVMANNQIYILNPEKNSLIRFNPVTKEKQTLLSDKIQLAKAIDITADDRFLYILEAEKSQILILDFEGKIIRSFSTSGTDECEFKNPVRIAVNYLGTLFVLDKNRGQILSFTNEGLFLKARNCSDALSMTIGIDQNLRLLSQKEKRYQIDIISPDLAYVSFIVLQGFNTDKGEIIDLASNDYGETYLINYTMCQISKVDETGNIIQKSNFGSKGKKFSFGTFSEPVMIKTGKQNNTPVLAIFDAGLLNIQFFEDKEFNPEKLVSKPPWAMRVALFENERKPFVDMLITDSLRYYIETDDDKNMKLYCENAQTKTFEIKNTDSKNKKFCSFDGMTNIGDSLFVTDSQNNSVNVRNRLTGAKIRSFGEKGSENGQFKSPEGITHDKENNLYICDKENNRISVWSRHGIFMRNITKADIIVSPSQILITKDEKLIILCNQKQIVEYDPQSNKFTVLITKEKITDIDFGLNDWLTVVDETNQNVLFYEGNKEVLRFGAMTSKSNKLFFKKLNSIRFNPKERILYLSDQAAQRSKLVKFYLPTVTPLNLNLVPALATETNITSQQVAKLTWDFNANAQYWYVYAYSATDTSYYNTETNQYILDNPQSEAIQYKVLSVSEDNKLSLPTQLIADDYSYARHLENAGNYLQAIETYTKFSEYNKAFDIQTAVCRNYYALAQSCASQRDYENALTYYNFTRKFSAQPDTIVTKIIKIYKQMSAWQRGIDFLLSLELNNAFTKREMLSFLYLSEDYDAAVDCAQDLLKVEKDNLEISQYLAFSKENLRLYSDALNVYSQIVKQNPTVQYQLKVADLLIKLEKYDEAIVLLQRVYTQNSQTNAAEIQFMLGLSYLGKQSFVRASDYFGEALRLDNSNSEYYYYQGYAYLMDRKNAEAINCLNKAHQLLPENFTYGYELAQIYEKDGRLNEALTLLDKIRVYVPSDSSALDFRLFYGNVLMQKKRYDDAYRELQAALKMYPNNQSIIDKNKEVFLAREQDNLKREPLEIKQTFFEQIYPSLLEYYKTHAIGYVTLFNTRNIPIHDIKLTVNVPEITSIPFEKIIPSVLAGDETQIAVILDFAPKLLNQCEMSSQDFIATVSAEYVWDNIPKSATDTRTITALKVQAMNWNNRSQLGCFINPADENIRTVGISILNSMKVPQNDELPKNIVQVMQVYSWLSAMGIRYISDPAASNAKNSAIDYVQFPYQTFQNKGGDCDDLLVLVSSLLSGIGINTAFVDLPEHVIPAFDTGMTTEDIEKYGFNRADFITRGNTIWMILETTVLGKENFYRSWKSAVEAYKQTMESGIIPEFFVFNDSQQNYPPVNYTKAIESDTEKYVTDATSKYSRDWEFMTNAGQVAIEEEFLKTLKLYPSNLSYKNRFALWYVETGKIESAQDLWSDILQAQPAHCSALINLGNLKLMENDFASAKDYYEQAIVANPLQKDNVLRNLCIMEYRAGNIVSAREYFRQILDSSTLRRLNPEIYQELLQ
jgi:tetratricopeptide (TPR) repeat protein/sugar lactone lactonase YvrE